MGIFVREQQYEHVCSVGKDEVTAVQARNRLAASERGRQSGVLVRGSTESPEKVKLLGWPRVHAGEKSGAPGVGARDWRQGSNTSARFIQETTEDQHTNTRAQAETEGLCLSLIGTAGPLGRRCERRPQVRLLRE